MRAQDRPAGLAMPRLRLTFGQLWSWLAVALPVLGAVIAPMSTVDLAYNVRAGQLMLETRRLLETDPFTFSAAGQPWLDQQWGAQILLALGFGVVGWAGLAVIRALLVGLIFWMVQRSCRALGADRRTAAWLTLASFAVSLVALGLRPQLLGMVLFAAVSLLIIERDRSPRRLWLVPVLVAIWANLHGSFVFGPALVGVAWFQDVVARRPSSRRTGVVLIASLVASWLTPFGPGVWLYVATLSTNPSVRGLITEWQATSPLTFPGALFYVSGIAVAVTMGISLRRARRASPAMLLGIAWAVVLFVLAAWTQRAVAWWALGAPLVLAPLLPVRDGRERQPSVANGVIAAGLAALIVILLPIWRPADPMIGPTGLLTDAPAGITRAVQPIAGPDARLFNAQRWGSWLEFAVPEANFFVDSRVEAIPAAVWADEAAISGGSRDWGEILDRWRVTAVVASNADQAALMPLIRADVRWREAYRDGDGAIFVRR
ncbi:MAG: hypothetical protein E6I45_08865 [Chloroflexi bacterium]|nr:MAG: hypothetical protein E6I45_08865 [Chloroflexota bacterium]